MDEESRCSSLKVDVWDETFGTCGKCFILVMLMWLQGAQEDEVGVLVEDAGMKLEYQCCFYCVHCLVSVEMGDVMIVEVSSFSAEKVCQI